MYGKFEMKILSRASGEGSPTNRPGSDKTQDQGSFGPFTGGLSLTPTGEPPTCGVTLKLHRI